MLFFTISTKTARSRSPPFNSNKKIQEQSRQRKHEQLATKIKKTLVVKRRPTHARTHDSSNTSNTSNNTKTNNKMTRCEIDEYSMLKRGEIDAGTSIIAVRFDGGVVLGADSRTSTGTYIANRVSDKLTPLHDRIFCCRSGSAADTQALSDYVKYFLGSHAVDLGRLPKVHTAANLFRSLCYNNKDRLLAGIIVAGWDPVKGGQVFSIPIGGAMVEQDFAIGGSGSTYIYGLVDAEYRCVNVSICL